MIPFLLNLYSLKPFPHGTLTYCCEWTACAKCRAGSAMVSSEQDPCTLENRDVQTEDPVIQCEETPSPHAGQIAKPRAPHLPCPWTLKPKLHLFLLHLPFLLIEANFINWFCLCSPFSRYIPRWIFVCMFMCMLVSGSLMELSCNV